jgi:hypothetical protein
MGPPLSSSGPFERTDVMSQNDRQHSGPGEEKTSVPAAPGADATPAEPAPDDGDENPVNTAAEPAPRSELEPTDVPTPPAPALLAAPGAAVAGEPGQRRVTRHTTTSTTRTETTTDETVVETVPDPTAPLPRHPYGDLQVVTLYRSGRPVHPRWQTGYLTVHPCCPLHQPTPDRPGAAALPLGSSVPSPPPTTAPASHGTAEAPAPQLVSAGEVRS